MFGKLSILGCIWTVASARSTLDGSVPPVTTTLNKTATDYTFTIWPDVKMRVDVMTSHIALQDRSHMISGHGFNETCETREIDAPECVQKAIHSAEAVEKCLLRLRPKNCLITIRSCIQSRYSVIPDVTMCSSQGHCELNAQVPHVMIPNSVLGFLAGDATALISISLNSSRAVSDLEYGEILYQPLAPGQKKLATFIKATGRKDCRFNSSGLATTCEGKKFPLPKTGEEMLYVVHSEHYYYLKNATLSPYVNITSIYKYDGEGRSLLQKWPSI